MAWLSEARPTDLDADMFFIRHNAKMLAQAAPTADAAIFGALPLSSQTVPMSMQTDW